MHATDATNAARTLLLDIRDARWDAHLCDLFGVPMGAGNIGGLLGPYVIGLIRARSDSFSGPVWFVAAVMACGAILISLLHASERRLTRGQ